MGRRRSAIAKNLEKQLEKDVKVAKNAQRIKGNLASENFKLDINPDMMMVKDFYWSMQFEKLEITPKQAASQCGIKPKAGDEWFSIPEIKEWFEEPPLKLRPQLKAVCLMAMRRGREIMQGEGTGAEKMIQYFIDQAQGKAKEKAANALMDEDDLSEDIGKIEELMAKAEVLRGGESAAEVQGESTDGSPSSGGFGGGDRDSSSDDETNTQDGKE